MLCTLKVSIHNIKVGPSLVPKGPPDHYFHILICTICLDHVWLPLLCYCTKAPLVPFTPPPLCRALITLYIHLLFLWANVSMCKGLSKPLTRILLSKKRSSFALLVLDTMCLKDPLDCFLLKCDRARRDDLCIGILGEFPYMP
jgi:hypothetical protein